MNKIKLISDSSCDLPDDLLQKYDIDLLPLYIIMGENSYKDGKEISQEEVFAWSDANNTTPKTAAPSLQDAMDILNLYVKDYDDIIVINISSEVSTTYQVMNIAAREYPNANIHIIDSRSVSAGVATLVLKAAKMKETGATAQKIVDTIKATVPKVRISFVVDTTTYLYRGGRCSALESFGAGFLHIKPELVVKDGEIIPGNKFRGKLDKVLMQYVTKMHDQLETADPSHVFITYSSADPQTVQEIKNYLESFNRFEQIICSYASCVISSHCGPGTLGVIFIKGE